uniref:Uncharacterized protein n=1 Tax=Oryza meridionalis TaxID=40149 RepID=A0A0E0DZV0_9ORYZ
MATMTLSVIPSPPLPEDVYGALLMTAEGGGLGFAAVLERSNLHLWSKPKEEWEHLQDVRDLKTLLPQGSISMMNNLLIGFADGGVRVVVVRTYHGPFIVELGSTGPARVALRRSGINAVFPYTSFCTPARIDQKQGTMREEALNPDHLALLRVLFIARALQLLPGHLPLIGGEHLQQPLRLLQGGAQPGNLQLLGGLQRGHHLPHLLPRPRRQVAEGAAGRLVVGVLDEGVALALVGGRVEGGEAEGADGADELAGVAELGLGGVEADVADVDDAAAAAVHVGHGGSGLGQWHSHARSQSGARRGEKSRRDGGDSQRARGAGDGWLAGIGPGPFIEAILLSALGVGLRLGVQLRWRWREQGADSDSETAAYWAVSI